MPKSTIKTRRKTVSWERDEPYRPSLKSTIKKRRKTICKELDKPKIRSKLKHHIDPLHKLSSKTCVLLPSVDRGLSMKAMNNVLSPLEVISFKKQLLRDLKPLSWTEKMLSAPPLINFAKIQQRRKTLLSSPLLNFQNSPDFDSNSNDSVILVSSDIQRSVPSTSNTVRLAETFMTEKERLKKDKVDKKQKLKFIDKSEGHQFKSREVPLSETSIESTVLGFKNLHLKTSSEEDVNVQTKKTKSCLKSTDSLQSAKKPKSITFKPTVEDQYSNMERLKSLSQSILHSEKVNLNFSPIKTQQKDNMYEKKFEKSPEKSGEKKFEKIRKRRQSEFQSKSPTKSEKSKYSFHSPEKKSKSEFEKIKKRRQSQFQGSSSKDDPYLFQDTPHHSLVTDFEKFRKRRQSFCEDKSLVDKKSKKKDISPVKKCIDHKNDTNLKNESKESRSPTKPSNDPLKTSTTPNPFRSHQKRHKNSVKFKGLPPERGELSALPAIELVNELIGPPTPPSVVIQPLNDVNTPPADLQRTLDNFEMRTENREHHSRITHRRYTTTDAPSNSRILTRRLSTVPDDNGVSSTVEIEETIQTPITSPAVDLDERTPPPNVVDR
ncbi:hypothetical protein ACFFRR_011571 [Megaselia abdita]